MQRAALAALAVAGTLTSIAAGVVSETRLEPSDPQPSEKFGSAVATDGEIAVVGARSGFVGGLRPGSAHVFVRSGDGWVEQQKLIADDGQHVDRFGVAIALDEDTLLIGADGDDDNGLQSGSAYVFVRNGGSWNQQAKLVASDGAAGDEFGATVAVNGDTALIGARSSDTAAPSAGAAYIFTRNGGSWSQTIRLTATDAEAADVFGSAVAIEGTTAMIAASHTNDNGLQSGSVYWYELIGNSWLPRAKLFPDDAAANGYFGTSVSLDGDRLLVGAGLLFARGAYIFEYDGADWEQQVHLLPPDGSTQDWFGASAALDDPLAVVGAPWDNLQGAQAGTAWAHNLHDGEWIHLLGPDAGPSDFYGESVAVSGSTVLIGAWGNSVNGNQSGAAYVYELEMPGDSTPAMGVVEAAFIALVVLGVGSWVIRRRVAL